MSLLLCMCSFEWHVCCAFLSSHMCRIFILFSVAALALAICCQQLQPRFAERVWCFWPVPTVAEDHGLPFAAGSDKVMVEGYEHKKSRLLQTSNS